MYIKKYFQHTLGVVGDIYIQIHYTHKNKLYLITMVRKCIIHTLRYANRIAIGVVYMKIILIINFTQTFPFDST